jgi:hypothetical protein
MSMSNTENSVKGIHHAASRLSNYNSWIEHDQLQRSSMMPGGRRRGSNAADI